VWIDKAHKRFLMHSESCKEIEARDGNRAGLRDRLTSLTTREDFSELERNSLDRLLR